MSSKVQGLIFGVWITSLMIIITILAYQIVTLDEQKSSIGFLLWKARLWVWHKILFPSQDTKCSLQSYYNNNNNKTSPHSRILVMQINHKPAHQNTWWGMTAAINWLYIQSIPNTDYIYIQLIPPSTINQKEWVFRNNGWRLRTGHWARLPIMKKIIMDYPQYNRFLYMDADVVFSPRQDQHPPIDWFLNTPSCLTKEVAQEIVFFSNFPQEPHMPCSGVFLISPNSSAKSASSILESWWQMDTSSYFDSNSEYDQHALHELIYTYPTIVSLIDIRPFDFSNNRDPWIYHFSGSDSNPDASLKRLLSLPFTPSLTTLNSIAALIQTNMTMQCYFNKMEEGPARCD